MARIENNPYDLRGKVGNYVYKKRGNKTYVCAAPRKYRISRSKAAIANREKFFFFTKLGKAVGENYLLNMQWKDVDLPGNTINKIIKLYYHDTINYDLSNFNLVKNREDQFPVSAVDMTFNSTSINVVLAPFPEDEKISIIKTPLFSAQGSICLHNGEYKRKDKFLFFSLSSADLDTMLNQEIEVKFKIPFRQYKQLSLYPEKVLLLNIALKNSAGKPLRFSKTLCYKV